MRARWAALAVAAVLLGGCGDDEGSTLGTDASVNMDAQVQTVGVPVDLTLPGGAGEATWTLEDVAWRKPGGRAATSYTGVDFTVAVTAGEWYVSGFNMVLVSQADPSATYTHELVPGDADLPEADVPAGETVTGRVHFNAEPGDYVLVLGGGNVQDGIADLAGWPLTIDAPPHP